MRMLVQTGLWTLTLSVCLHAAEHRNQFERTFDLGAGAKQVVVDNVWGSIRVTGTNSNTAKLVVNELWTADSDADLAEARREVKLDITQNAGVLKVYVDGPFRCQNGGLSFRRHSHYEARFDFTLEVPRDSEVRLDTVNRGDIVVRDVRGRFDVHNVNGGVEMSGLAGSGEALTVNGPVRLQFTQNPKETLRVKTVNGKLDVQLQPSLSADLRMKTLNGGMYTDFDVTRLPNAPAEVERAPGRFRLRTDAAANLRAGNGGPQYSFETLNGQITIRKAQGQ